jgi:hypothetical protein
MIHLLRSTPAWPESASRASGHGARQLRKNTELETSRGELLYWNEATDCVAWRGAPRGPKLEDVAEEAGVEPVDVGGLRHQQRMSETTRAPNRDAVAGRID